MIPVGDFLRRRTTPYVNWTLIAINFAVFAYMALNLNTQPDSTIGGFATSEADRFLSHWGFEPACLAQALGFSTNAPQRELALFCSPGKRELLEVFTAMFVHAGWAHILGNMLFLWIFGDNVEDRMGHARYAVFYLVCGVAAAALQTVMAIDTVVPSVGASGAIAGVLAAYLVLYPTAKVDVIILPFFFLPFTVPAVALIVIWFLTQVLSGLAAVGTATAGSGVAWWAHVGGFAAGIVLVWFFKKPRERSSQSFEPYEPNSG